MNKEIQKEIDELKGLIDEVTGWQMEAQLVSLLRLKWPDLKVTYSVASQIGQLKGVLIQAYPKNTEDLEPVIEFLNDCGLKCKKVEDFQELQRKTWDYGNIKLSAFFNSKEKGACQYVKVGTKEEPVYELKCNDDTEGNTQPEQGNRDNDIPF